MYREGQGDGVDDGGDNTGPWFCPRRISEKTLLLRFRDCSVECFVRLLQLWCDCVARYEEYADWGILGVQRSVRICVPRGGFP